MIALRDNFPLVVGPSGAVLGFRPERLQSSLRRAARKAGHENWHGASDVVAGVYGYLECRYRSNVIAVSRLEELVRQALRDLGMSDVAQVFGSRLGTASYYQLTLSL